LPSSIPYAALLTYSPRGTSKVSIDSKTVCYAIKRGDEAMVRRAVTRLAEKWEEADMAGFFGSDVTLVPAPRSSLLLADALWPADVICKEMVRQGLARCVEPLLRRVTAVPKASTARPGERPDVEKHLATLEAESRLTGGRITVVDDVVTQGRMLYAASERVQEAAPTATVAAFALVRTMGYVPDVEKILDPCVGTLTYSWGDVRREP
jgi:hypothetical protein